MTLHFDMRTARGSIIHNAHKLRGMSCRQMTGYGDTVMTNDITGIK